MHAHLATYPHAQMSGYVLEFTNLGLHPLINQGKWKEKRFFAFRNNCSPSISNQGCCSRLCVGELKAKAGKSQGPGGSSRAGATKEEEEEEGNFQLLMAVKSSFNDILIVDTPKSRMLLLDSTRMLPLPHADTHIHVATPGVAIFIYILLTVDRMQIMFIAFFTRTRNGRVPTGYVKLFLFLCSLFISPQLYQVTRLLFLQSSLSYAILPCNIVIESS